MFSLTKLVVISLVIVLTECGVSVHNPFYCYSEDPIRPQNGWFGIHTAYETNRGQSINANASTCTPSKFWILSRHGTRWPNVGELNRIWAINSVYETILSNYNQGRTSLCAGDIALLRDWVFDPYITEDLAQYVTSVGRDELEGIARRFQAAFPTLLPSTYSPSHYLFRGSVYQRTQVSLQHFAEGLFYGSENVHFRHETPDYLIRAYSLCPLYNEVVASLPEQAAFREGPEFQQMTLEVSAKLGFHGSHVLRSDEVVTLSFLCKYEQIWYPNDTSPFCSAFSVANRQVIEYFEDLEFYYRVGPGNLEYRRLFENVVCFNMQELVGFLLSNDPNDQTARIYTGHIVPMPMILNNLGYFGEREPLTRHNFAQQTERLWRTGQIMSMAANLAVIRFDCASGDNDIQFLYNERPLVLPGCDENGVCKQSLIEERLGHWLDADCMQTFCSNS